MFALWSDVVIYKNTTTSAKIKLLSLSDAHLRLTVKNFGSYSKTNDILRALFHKDRTPNIITQVICMWRKPCVIGSVRDGTCAYARKIKHSPSRRATDSCENTRRICAGVDFRHWWIVRNCLRHTICTAIRHEEKEENKGSAVKRRELIFPRTFITVAMTEMHASRRFSVDVTERLHHLVVLRSTAKWKQ